MSITYDVPREEALERIDEAISLLRRGWAKGVFQHYHNGVLRVCVQRACEMTMPTPFHLHDWLQVAIADICRELHGCNIVKFNDTIAQSVDEVIALFEKVRAEI